MAAIIRGIRNVYRNKVRTLIVILILSMSIGVFLTMVIVDEGVEEEIGEVRSNVGTTIEVRPAGSFGGFTVGKRPGGGGLERGRAGFEPQHFSTRSDLACGSTIGPITAARVGVPTVDVGNPMLSMHSCREMAGAADVQPMIDVLRLFYEG